MDNALPYDVAQVDELSTALLNSYNFVRRLIHSGTTVIYEVISTRGRLRGRHLALKKVPHSANLIPSVLLHRAICHPNIIALHSVIDLSSAPHFAYWHVLEFCSEGNLSDLLLSRDLSEAELRLVTKGITSALIYLKEERIIHRNVDSTNILLGQGCKPKICDFKHAVHVPSGESSISQPLTGTVHPAPELVTIPSQYDFAVDTWSFGCVLYICIGGTIDDIPRLVSKNVFPLFPKCSPELRCLILALLSTSADERLDIEQVAKTEYLMSDLCTSQSDSFGDSRRCSPVTHMPSTSNLRSLPFISTTLPTFEGQKESQKTQKQNSGRICTPSTITRSGKRPALKDVGNIPLPRFLQSQLESGKDLSSNHVKRDYCSNSATTSVPNPSDNSQTSLTFLGKLSKPEIFVPVEPSADKTDRAILPIGTTRPLPIDTSSLPPKIHKLANGTITILASHALLVDFRQNQRRHGHKGDQIMLIECKRVSIFDAPHLSVPSCLMEPVHIYDLSDLPPTYWKQYNDAANFVDQIKRKIPHVTLYESDAKCTLMSNPAPSDIEIILYGEDSSSDKTKARGFKAKLQAPTMRIQYSRQQHHLELAQKLTGDRGTEWKKECRTCLDSSDISRILFLNDTNQLAKKGLRVLLDFLKTCDQLESPAPAGNKRKDLLSLTSVTSVPASKFQPATVLPTPLPFVFDTSSLLEGSRYLESVGWCIRRPGRNAISGNAKYQILFLDGASLVVDLTKKDLVFSPLHGDPIRCQISDHGWYPPRVQKYAHFIDNFVSLF